MFVTVSLENSVENCELPIYPGASSHPAAVNYMDSLGAVVACGTEDLDDASKCWAYADGNDWTALPDANQQQ